MRFQHWQPVEAGEIQVRESPRGDDDLHGYAVVRAKDDKRHDLYLRVWNGRTISVIIMPRSDEPLPRQGQRKIEIIEEMELVGGKRADDDYTIWLERMKNVE